MTFIRLDNVSFYYESKRPLIDNLDLDFKKGGFTAVMGPNGSGKTTLGKLLAGILKPVAGRITIEGMDASKIGLAQIGSRIGYLFQNPELQIFSKTVYDELSFIPSLMDGDQLQMEKEIDSLLSLMGLEHKKQSMTFSLSYGEKQRLAIASLLFNKPRYLVLDEPTTGLDLPRKEKLLAILKDLLGQGIGMTVITHDARFVKNFKGRLIEAMEGDFFESTI